MEHFRGEGKRAIDKKKEGKSKGVSHFEPRAEVGECFFGYVFPFPGVVVNPTIVIDELGVDTIVLVVDIKQSNGFNTTRDFIVKEGTNEIENFKVLRGDKIKLRFRAGEEVGIHIKDVFIGMELVQA